MGLAGVVGLVYGRSTNLRSNPTAVPAPAATRRALASCDLFARMCTNSKALFTHVALVPTGWCTRCTISVCSRLTILLPVNLIIPRPYASGAF